MLDTPEHLPIPAIIIFAFLLYSAWTNRWNFNRASHLFLKDGVRFTLFMMASTYLAGLVSQYFLGLALYGVILYLLVLFIILVAPGKST